MAQVNLLKRGGTVDRDVAPRPAGGRSLPDHVRRHPASLVAPPFGAPSADAQERPEYVTAGMVLLSAATVFQGYRWLNVIPGGRTHLTAPVFAVLALPAALVLTRSHRRARHGWPARLIGLSTLVLLVATVVETAVGHLWSARALGASDLLLALTLFGSALISGGFRSPWSGSGPT